MADKYYLQAENERNVAGHKTFEKLLKIAFGANEVVMVGHHFVLAPGGDITKGVNEIPSADTAIFDHVIMKRVFGKQAINVMIACARKPVEERDAELTAWLNTVPFKEESDPTYFRQFDEPDNSVVGDYPETAGGY